LARLRTGDPPKGPWPAPVVDRIEALAAKYAEAWPAWGYRKIAAMMRADGHEVTNSSVQRALRRRGLLLPQGFRADRKSWAVLRRRVFRDPPTERNRVWQTDFSEFENHRHRTSTRPDCRRLRQRALLSRKDFPNRFQRPGPTAATRPNPH
jgi:hypothetical protein